MSTGPTNHLVEVVSAVFHLTLECGHIVFRPTNGPARPPKRVICEFCYPGSKKPQ